MKLNELARQLGASVVGDTDAEIHRLSSLKAACKGDLTFIVSAKYKPALASTKASAVLIPASLANDPDFDAARDTACAALVCDSPYNCYAAASWILHPDDTGQPGVASNASVHSSATVAASASIGEFAVIGAGAQVDEGAVIGSHCTLGENVRIGACTRLMPRVSIAHDCLLGEHCRVQSGAVIGSEGFGFAPTQSGWQAIHQIGRVVIGDRVHIGSNTTIDRGALDDTVIADGAILDNQIQIAHNVRIGENSAIAACVGIAGSTVVGRNCQLGGACMVVGHLHICDHAIVNGGSTITQSITEPGRYASGVPLMPASRWRRAYVLFTQLDSLARRIRKLERHQDEPS